MVRRTREPSTEAKLALELVGALKDRVASLERQLARAHRVALAAFGLAATAIGAAVSMAVALAGG